MYKSLYYTDYEFKILYSKEKYNYLNYLIQNYQTAIFEYYPYDFCLKEDKEKNLINDLKKSYKYKNNLYIHIPFCRTKCKFCYFKKELIDKNNINRYMRKIYLQFNKFLNNKIKLNNVWFGGGTPLVLPTYHLNKLLKMIKKLNCNKKMQINIETTPNEITKEKIKILKKYGVNRISIGIQTLDESLSKNMNRYQSLKLINEKIKLLNKYNIRNISVDLLVSMPNQTFNSLKNDINKIIKLNISCIHLNIFTPFECEYFKKLKINNKHIKLRHKMIKYSKKILMKNGYKRYDVESFSKNIESSNMVFKELYEDNSNQISLGSKVRGHIYLKKMYISNLENNKFKYYSLKINKDIEIERYISLHLIHGIDIFKINKKFNINFERKYNNLIKKLLKIKYIKKIDNKIYFNLDLNYINTLKYFQIIKLFWSKKSFKLIVKNSINKYNKEIKYENTVLKFKMYDENFLRTCYDLLY